MMLETLFSLKTMESLENEFQPHSGVIPSFSIRTELVASSQSCRCVDDDTWCKQAVSGLSEQNCTIFLVSEEIHEM